MSQEIEWNGNKLKVLNKDANWSDASGIYIFAGIVGEYWEAFYIGKCDSFKNRIPDHERWNEAAQLGATHVHAKTVSQAASRDNLEESLIREFQPPLNTHHR